MNIEEIRTYCLSKNGVTEDCAFGPDTILFRLCGKIFACMDLNRPNLVVLKSEEEEALVLRERYKGIQGAWHWNKKYWNDVYLDADVEDEVVLNLLDRSYCLIRSHLPKKTLFNFSDLPDGWNHQHFSVLDSAMNKIRCEEMKAADSPVLLITSDFQTAGRGQGKNTWESEDKKNLLFAFRFFPVKVKAVDQFGLLQCISLAVALSVEKYYRSGVSIKWPNDIYCDDRKICGILIEHNLCGQYIMETRCGIGINVNQDVFLSTAPNPVSIRQLVGHDVDRAAVLRHFINNFCTIYNRYLDGETLQVAKEYLSRLYRAKGWHLYRDGHGEFEARFLRIEHDGRLTLKTRDKEERTYAHKEVEFLLKKKYQSSEIK